MSEKFVTEKPRLQLNPQVFIGGIVLLVGVLLLIDTMNLGDMGSVFQFFPLLFIAFGVYQIVSNQGRNWIGPAIMIAFFTIVQLLVLDIVPGNIFTWIWPLVLIGIGVSIIFGRGGNGAAPEGADQFSLFAMFGGGNRLITSENFHGGDVTAIFGGFELDVSEATVQTRPAVINAFVMFGGLGIKASNDMLIRNDVLPLFGGVGDDRRQRKALAGETPELIVKGVVLFGGIGIEEKK